MKDVTQVQFTTRCIIEEGRMHINQLLWVSPQRAKELVEANVARIPPAKAGPSETQVAGATETKKLSDGEPGGQSTDSPKLTEPLGADAPLSASEVEPVSSATEESRSSGTSPRRKLFVRRA